MNQAQRQYEQRRLRKQQQQLEAYARPMGDKRLQIKLRGSEVERRNMRLAKTLHVDLSTFEDTPWYQHFYSSNVWKFKIVGKDLMIMFLNGSVYLYPGSAYLFIGMLRTGSKGKFVWRNIRRKHIPYTRLR